MVVQGQAWPECSIASTNLYAVQVRLHSISSLVSLTRCLVAITITLTISPRTPTDPQLAVPKVSNADVSTTNAPSAANSWSLLRFVVKLPLCCRRLVLPQAKTSTRHWAHESDAVNPDAVSIVDTVSHRYAHEKSLPHTPLKLHTSSIRVLRPVLRHMV